MKRNQNKGEHRIKKGLISVGIEKRVNLVRGGR